jgi:hypothetical protein
MVSVTPAGRVMLSGRLADKEAGFPSRRSRYRTLKHGIDPVGAGRQRREELECQGGQDKEEFSEILQFRLLSRMRP